MAKPMRIRTDDQVVVIAGKDAGKTGPRRPHRSASTARSTSST